MKTTKNKILIINGGSSSIKFALYNITESIKLVGSGKMERIGEKNTILSYTDPGRKDNIDVSMDTSNDSDTSSLFINWLEMQVSFKLITAIGHRIVQGMHYTQPMVVTTELLDELEAISMYDPDHLPEEIKLIQLFKTRYPSMPQIACFDTAFHTSTLPVAKLIPVPKRFLTKGVQRYGFHGISYEYLMQELERIAGTETANGKIILAHLGSGASLSVVREGKCMDTSMGFTATSGLVMSTRPGDLDPGIAWYLIEEVGLTATQFNNLINHECGLLGISETSSDIRDLLDAEKSDHRAAEAIELFCYQTKKWIGSFATVSSGIDTLIFSGGIGEHAAEIRRRICEGLGFLGIELDDRRNAENEQIISSNNSDVCVRVIKTNEALMIARSVCKLMNYSIKN